MLILDATCGGRHLWFEKSRSDTIYVDRRVLPKGTIPVRPNWEVRPTICASFTMLPFRDECFDLVVFDPPHIIRDKPSKSYLRTKYGEMRSDSWEDTLRAGFSESWRVLRPGGTLHFKWANSNLPLKTVLALLNVRPLFKVKQDVSWSTFLKPDGYAMPIASLPPGNAGAKI